MRLFASLALALSIAISLITPSLGHAHQARRHHVHRQDDLARRDPGEINIYKRYDNCRFTYFAVGLGSCGVVSQSSDFMVALNSAQYDSGSYCFQMISITINGKTAQAQILDRCPGCPFGGLDLSQGLFEFFADVSAGVLTGTWNFGSGSPPPPPSPSPPPPPPPPSPPPTISVDIPATSWLPLPTTTWQPPSSSATSAPSTTISSHSNSTTASSGASSLAPTQTTTVAVAVTAGAIPGANSSVLLDVNLSIVYIGQFLGACSGL